MHLKAGSNNKHSIIKYIFKGNSDMHLKRKEVRVLIQNKGEHDTEGVKQEGCVLLVEFLTFRIHTKVLLI